eukprot:sb/3470229/
MQFKTGGQDYKMTTPQRGRRKSIKCDSKTRFWCRKNIEYASRYCVYSAKPANRKLPKNCCILVDFCKVGQDAPWVPPPSCQSIGLIRFSLLGARENCGQSIGLTASWALQRPGTKNCFPLLLIRRLFSSLCFSLCISLYLSISLSLFLSISLSPHPNLNFSELANIMPQQMPETTRCLALQQLSLLDTNLTLTWHTDLVAPTNEQNQYS